MTAAAASDSIAMLVTSLQRNALEWRRSTFVSGVVS
jgi:hypothetical protein